MNRVEFEALRDLPGKVIRGDIVFSSIKRAAPLKLVENVHIENARHVDARLNITYNTEIDSISFNVHVVGVGPICRLDVGGLPHRPAGRSHKHALRTVDCADRNIPDEVQDRADLLGRTPRELFEEFCRLGKIEHVDGVFHSPEEA